MEGFNIVDGIVLATVVISSLLAYSRGLVREVMAIVGWVVAAIAAFVFSPQVMPLIKEIPMVGPILGDSCELSIIASFAAVFAIVLLIASFFHTIAVERDQQVHVGQAGPIFGIYLWRSARHRVDCHRVLCL